MQEEASAARDPGGWDDAASSPISGHRGEDRRAACVGATKHARDRPFATRPRVEGPAGIA